MTPPSAHEMIAAGPAALRGVERAEEPAGADDRADAGEQQPDHADMSFELGLVRLVDAVCGVRGHVHLLFHGSGTVRPRSSEHPSLPDTRIGQTSSVHRGFIVGSGGGASPPSRSRVVVDVATGCGRAAPRRPPA